MAEPIHISLAEIEGNLIRNEIDQWELWDFDFDAGAPFIRFPAEVSEEDAKQRASDFLRGYAAGLHRGEHLGRVALQAELRALIGAGN